MLKRYKDLLRTIVGPLRTTLAGTAQADGTWLRGDLDRELERLGIAPDGTLTPLDALPNASPAERRARYAAEVAITTAVNGAKGAEAERKRAAAREEVIERAAYTWINRLLALRAMEARGLIDETLRNNPDYDGVSEALFILRSDAPGRTAGTDGGWWAVLEDACKAQAEALPGLFDLSDPAAALRPSTAALLRCVALVGTAPNGYTLEEADAAFADPDAIGWAYQFYQEAAKARVYAKLGSGGKAASRAEIAAATQLFTEPYMVQWLLQNSLGRSYHEAYPDSKLPETWAYYIRQRPEGQQPAESPRPLHALDLIDPCCGSGHFLREAFDMYAAMYRERHPELSAAEIADRILTHHLHGIDLDPRAAQLTALTLYLRAWEYAKAEGKRQKAKLPSSFVFRPSSLNIATTPSIAFNEGSASNSKSRTQNSELLARHLRRHPEDRVMKPLLEGVFAALEQADILGSLLRPAEHIDTAIKALQQPHTIEMDFDADDAALRRTITALAHSDPAELKRMLLDRVAQSFHAEAGTADDVAVELFGREAEGGVRLLQLLDRKYAVVVTNPPYMGSKNMETLLRKYVEQNYRPGKRDLYATFLMRCLELCKRDGRVAMVTMQGWMFLRSFVELRAVPTKKLSDTHKRGTFSGVLRSTQVEALVHLGRYAFSELGNAVIAPVMFALRSSLPEPSHQFWGCRLIAPRPSAEQDALLLRSVQQTNQYTTSKQSLSETFTWTRQSSIAAIPEAPMCYWLRSSWLDLLSGKRTFEDVAFVREGLHTTDNMRFLRCFWECSSKQGRWIPYVKGGGYRRWAGLEWLCVDWEFDGGRIKSMESPVIPSYELYFREGFTYTDIANGAMGIRYLPEGRIFDAKGPVIIAREGATDGLASVANTRPVTFLLRALSPALQFRTGYVNLVPVPNYHPSFNSLGKICVSLAELEYVTSVIESSFRHPKEIGDGIVNISTVQDITRVYRLAIEAVAEKLAFSAYKLGDQEIQDACLELGIPAGWHPLIAGYDALPELPAGLDLPPLPQEVTDYLTAHERISPVPAELARIKAKLRALYEAGPGATTNDDEAASGTEYGEDDEGEGAVSGAHIPIPTETFLEELSVKMQIHPISIYWLLEELRREGARCKPEEQRLLEDRLSVIVLRLLGHRWPKQIEAGEPLPSWADADGIVPISGNTGEQTLAERVRARLRAEDGDLGAQRAEALLSELTGLSLEDWLRREFFKRHVRQFKYRPIAWHLASDPSVAVADAKAKKRLGGRRHPTFECMVYYHACGGDVLARIRTQYVEPLLRAARQQLEQAGRAKDEDGVVQANMRIQELEEFNRRLQQVAERGFASPELAAICENEPLDRWDHDGYLSPASREDFLRQEQAWRVDLNDGVRVNIAPIQFAGLLISDVLKAADAKKAIADRARWRSDERRWVRAGKLPRCGWMGDDVPESQEWTRLAPQREAEKAKLEEKRRAVRAEAVRADADASGDMLE
jgi:hypothetical protein